MANTVDIQDAAVQEEWGSRILTSAETKAQLWRLLRGAEGSGEAGITFENEEAKVGTFTQRYDSRLSKATVGQTENIKDTPSYSHVDAVSGSIIRLGKSTEVTALEQSKIPVNLMTRAAKKLREWAEVNLDIYAAYMLMCARTTIAEGDSGATISASLVAITQLKAYLNMALIGTHDATLTDATHEPVSAIFSAGAAGMIDRPVTNQWNDLDTTNFFSLPFAKQVYRKARQEGKQPLRLTVNGITKRGYLLAAGDQIFSALDECTEFKAEARAHAAVIQGPRDSAWFNYPVEGMWVGGLAIIPIMHALTDLSYGTVIPTEEITDTGWVRQCAFLLSEECVLTKLYRKPKVGLYHKDINDEDDVLGIAMYLGGTQIPDYLASTSSAEPKIWMRPMMVCYTAPAVGASAA